MSLHRCLAALWLAAFTGAYGINTAWAGYPIAPTSKFHPWVLVALFWAVALISIAIHHLARHLVRGAIALKRVLLARASRSLHAAAQAPAVLTRLAQTVTSSLASLWAMLSHALEHHTPRARAVRRAR